MVEGYGQPDVVEEMAFRYTKEGLSGVVLDENKNNIIDDNEPVIQVEAFMPYEGTTVEDNGIGSSSAGVEKEFGPPSKNSKNGQIEYRYQQKGISFFFDAREQRVQRVAVYPAGESPAAPRIPFQASLATIKMIRRLLYAHEKTWLKGE